MSGSDNESSEYDSSDILDGLPLSAFAHNPQGKNQYRHCPSKDDQHVKELIFKYDREGIKSPKIISEMLLKEHNIEMRPRTVSRRKKDYGLLNSHKTTTTLPETFKRQLVVDQLERDPGRRQGPTLIKEGIRMRTGLDLTRKYVKNLMRDLDPEGFQLRDPTSRKIKRRALVNLGIHEEWSGDGHDKLKKYGFAIYGIRDVWSGKWLGLWVIPDNRLKVVVAYLWLSLSEEYGGLPIQCTTDCGSETTLVYGLATALRETFFPEMPVDEVPAHCFLKSFDENVDEFWEQGIQDGIYDPFNSSQKVLALWLWALIIQKEINRWKERFNAHKTRKDSAKVNPSGVSPNVAFALYERYGGHDCLQRFTPEMLARVSELKKEIGDENLFHFTPPAFAKRCEVCLQSLNLTEEDLSLINAWNIFEKMMPLVFEEKL
ncbi:hypothetical protein M422DRAFT_240130 [Sphaerobolus stellatus SS14]|uniref:Integrase catalytic domain-containing protein n=1 Tax=Sphaerobolus stellatus (strain SS14) TaxID=990650 RepID=A0A0C9VYD6_SPHS4|nr:hypothetical protein M422DRAFT_253344 [Sphaerobolus stellatus SS14]KIJ49666.1 hypothetical protein M422DRAFT_246737 [Sphaerobolus stellatus SS14]KIJ55515.1 hypothetical protein M422DRAFT_240130 [Sphaerobolus stellatus SS14]